MRANPWGRKRIYPLFQTGIVTASVVWPEGQLNPVFGAKVPEKKTSQAPMLVKVTVLESIRAEPSTFADSHACAEASSEGVGAGGFCGAVSGGGGVSCDGGVGEGTVVGDGDAVTVGLAVARATVQANPVSARPPSPPRKPRPYRVKE